MGEGKVLGPEPFQLESRGIMTGLFRACKQQIGSFVYRCSGRVPFARGYSAYRSCYLGRFVGRRDFLQLFQEGRELPDGLGVGLDERVVEYPWILSRLMGYEGKCRFLDAGSTLNSQTILAHQLAKPHKWTIFTLAPERECFWSRGVSYVYDDLRSMPFREEWFDAVFCISVIEHVGMDNSLYASDKCYREGKTQDYLLAVDEVRRVLKPSGRLFLTVPFGIYEDHGWLQQFDSAMLSNLVSRFQPQRANISFYRYTSRGWRCAREGECRNLTYSDVHLERFSRGKNKAVDVDFAAAAHAVACLDLQK